MQLEFQCAVEVYKQCWLDYFLDVICYNYMLLAPKK